MKRAVVTGTSGHLGEALAITLADRCEVVGVDIKPGPHTTHLVSVDDAAAMADLMAGVTHVFHAATLHKPHVATHRKQQFVDGNISGTLALLEAAARQGVEAFVFTSTTSAFGASLVPPPGAPAAWITETVPCVPKNIYGSTKTAAEDLCHLFHCTKGLPCLVLRTSRFFLEADDNAETRARYADENIKAVEFLYRRVDIEDIVTSHLLAAARAPELGFGRYIISATTPFLPEDCAGLGRDAPQVLRQRVPEYEEIFEARDWVMVPTLDRVYDNAAARRDLNWQPKHDFRSVLRAVSNGDDPRSELALKVGSKSYHDEVFEEGPYPVET
ncbi:MAG: NAD(P)-dependent oxidoreductase [Pseudomonadota bacterium]